MKLYTQKPVQVTAVRLTDQTTINTLEGMESANPGDWLVTGILGEHWPVSHDTFNRKYKPVANRPGVFEKLPVRVHAQELTKDTTIETKWGSQSGKTGDWLVKDIVSGDFHIVVATVFEDCYQLIANQVDD
ncbi:MAG: PGDYG domain-containing protein [Candidatus Obscuribacterales bacterium]|jgi:hypothetical protein